MIASWRAAAAGPPALLQQLEVALTASAFVISAGLGFVSLLYLTRRTGRQALLAAAVAKAGFVAATAALIAMLVSTRQTSGTWWSWDRPAGLLLIVWLSYIAYFLIRSSTEPADRRNRFAAVFAFAALLDSPFLYLAVSDFVDGRSVGSAVRGFEGSPEDIAFVLTLFLSFSALMFYLYGAERSKVAAVSASPSNPDMTE